MPQFLPDQLPSSTSRHTHQKTRPPKISPNQTHSLSSNRFQRMVPYLHVCAQCCASTHLVPTHSNCHPGIPFSPMNRLPRCLPTNAFPKLVSAKICISLHQPPPIPLFSNRHLSPTSDGRSGWERLNCSLCSLSVLVLLL